LFPLVLPATVRLPEHRLPTTRQLARTRAYTSRRADSDRLALLPASPVQRSSESDLRTKWRGPHLTTIGKLADCQTRAIRAEAQVIDTFESRLHVSQRHLFGLPDFSGTVSSAHRERGRHHQPRRRKAVDGWVEWPNTPSEQSRPLCAVSQVDGTAVFRGIRRAFLASRPTTTYLSLSSNTGAVRLRRNQFRNRCAPVPTPSRHRR
jgi:hypothetical protein